MALSLLPVLLQNLNSLIQTEVGLLWGVDKDMNKLSSTLSTIQAVLEDAEQKQLRDKAIQDWLRKLKDAAYEVDDILDDCATEALRWKSKGQQSSASLNKASTSLLTCFPVVNIRFRHQIGTRMKEIITSLDEIADERKKFHLREAVVEYRDLFAESRETSSFLTQPELYGRDEEREKIVKVLVDDVCERDEVSVYPVIGIGGLGKTTLAQMVFNDDRVTSHFELKIWVYVSQDFDVKRVIKATIESAPGKACENLDEKPIEPLQRSLRDMLNGKRYLIVLDDVWNEDQEKWDRFKSALTYGSKGASVIVTTRDKKVASIMATIPPHELSFLSEDDCWWLFRQRAFGRENEERPNLVAIGKEIVKKCGGVPLAAKALGGLLRFKSEESEWLFVKESDIWNLPQDENSILPALRLSYYSLPLELRRCFAYCAVFPKGSRIEKGNLISLWMANGYISCKENLELEDIGERIWNELCWISFFQVADNDETDARFFRGSDLEVLHRIGCLTWFKMHDLVHDLSHYVMEDACQVMKSKSSDMRSDKKFRHVTLASQNDQPVKIHEAFHDVVSLRTLRQDPKAYRWDMHDFRKFVSLRVFDLSGEMMKYLPSSIGNLKHLRYLDLSNSEIKQLPNSICTLWNLQTLILTACWNLNRLPKNMKNLKSLRRLYLPSLVLVDMPPKIGHLTCLKTLTVFVVDKGRSCHLAELQHLNLEGKLRIEHLERVRNPVDAKEANLVGKQNLSCLELSWENNAESESQENVEEILEALEPPPNLKVLVIQNYRGTHWPRWMRDSVLAKKVDIKLMNCKNCLQLPPFGQLPLLQRLAIYGMDKVEYIDDIFPCGGPVRGFPSLEVLEIYSSPNLKGFSREEGRELLPCLHELVVADCPNFRLSSLKNLTVRPKCTNALLNSISNLNSLVSLEVYGNEEAICFPEDVLRNLASLESLRIERFTKLKVLPEGLVALKELFIHTCPELESLPEQGLRGLESLQHLEINLCNKLSSLSEGLQHLTALKKLQISGCPELVVLPEGIKHLTSLRDLTFSGGPLSWSSDEYVVDAKLVALPEALQHVPSLQTLWIREFPELASLPDWLGNLTSLQALYIINCPKIASLPASIQSLTRLEMLYIKACSPELPSRCEMERGRIGAR